MIKGKTKVEAIITKKLFEPYFSNTHWVVPVVYMLVGTPRKIDLIFTTLHEANQVFVGQKITL